MSRSQTLDWSHTQPTSSVPVEYQAAVPWSGPEPKAARRPPAEFEALFAAVASTAFGIAVRLTRSQADAEDLVQEAALLAFRAFASFEAGTNFRAWFFKILTNCYFSKCRRERSRPVTSDLDDTPDLYLYARSADAGFLTQGPDPAAQLLDRLGTERIVDAIDRLPEEYRVVSTFYFMEDLSYEEIAQVLGCPIGTVRSRLHRGRKMLQKALWQVAEESGIIGHHTTGASQ
jgi:RNA polymerase sigma-70 factor (ECF subfamily)